MKELRRNLFTGIDDEDAHEHVRRVLEIAYLFLNHGVTHDVKMLRVFPITLTRATSIWEKRLTPGVIITWDLLKKASIEQYCPPFKTARKLEEIQSFQQGIDEMILDIPTRIMLDSKEFIPLMIPAQALKSIQVMEDHSHNWYDEATTKESINDSLDNVDMKKIKENIHAFRGS
ncbi:hypothetical protein Tco_0129752, partial [Tanacetum coccineum]